MLTLKDILKNQKISHCLCIFTLLFELYNSISLIFIARLIIDNSVKPPYSFLYFDYFRMYVICFPPILITIQILLALIVPILILNKFKKYSMSVGNISEPLILNYNVISHLLI